MSFKEPYILNWQCIQKLHVKSNTKHSLCVYSTSTDDLRLDTFSNLAVSPHHSNCVPKRRKVVVYQACVIHSVCKAMDQAHGLKTQWALPLSLSDYSPQSFPLFPNYCSVTITFDHILSLYLLVEKLNAMEILPSCTYYKNKGTNSVNYSLGHIWCIS